MSEIINIPCFRCQAINRLPATRRTDNPTCGRCKESLLQGKTAEITASTWGLLSKTGLPVIVDCWAPWCAPCRSFAPVFQQAALELKTQAILVKLNTENEQRLGAQLAIRSIPTLIALDGGREVDRISGALSLSQLVQWIRPLLRY